MSSDAKSWAIFAVKRGFFSGRRRRITNFSLDQLGIATILKESTCVISCGSNGGGADYTSIREDGVKSMEGKTIGCYKPGVL